MFTALKARKSKIILVLALLLFSIGALFIIRYRTGGDEKPIRCIDCNIVLVSFDTLRADHVGAYGYTKNTTPTIDKFAQEGFVFTNAISVTSWTLPSHMSWFTGVYPSQHKVLNKFTVTNDGQEEITNLEKVSPGMLTLAEILKQNGYKTGGFTGGAGVNHEFGFDKGFDIYTDDKEFAGFSDSIPKALDWISQNKDEKIFVFLHGYDIHGQYVPEGGYDFRFLDFEYSGKLDGSKEEQKDLREEGLARGQIFLTPEDVKFLTSLYDEKVQRADKKFAQFVEKYSEMGLKDKTLFILTSDHGEELYEHGRIDHGHSLYEELIKIPLIIAFPGLKGETKISEQVGSIDFMPTILDLVGIEKSETLERQMSGRSLKSLMGGNRVALDVFPETDYRYDTFLRAIRTSDSWKLITDLENKSRQLYFLNKDSQERENKADSEASQFNKLNQLLIQHLNKFGVSTSQQNSR